MANAERIEQLLAWAQGWSSQINSRIAAAKDANEAREALGEANTFLHELREERKELAAEFGEVRKRLAAGRPPRQHRTTWARVEADLLADAAQYERGLATLDAQIREQEQLDKKTRAEFARLARSAEPARASTTPPRAPDKPVPTPVVRRLRRMVLWVAGGLGLLPSRPDMLLVCGGGRHNAAIMAALESRCRLPVRPVEAAGLDGDMIEAQGFAWLAARVLRGLPTSGPRTTGAPRAVCGGRISAPAG